MDLKYDGHEVIGASKSAVWAFITDPAQVGSCLPDLLEMNVVDPQHVDATVGVAVGPVRGKFKFKIALEPHPETSHLDMKISGGGFGSVVDLHAGSDVKENDDGTTTLDWMGTATMRGPVATVGGRVLDAQAKRVITTTFANVRAKLTAAA